MTEIRMSGDSNPEEVNFWLGKHGTARKVVFEVRAAAHAASLALWHITLDGQSDSQKRHYGLSVYHLRDVPGTPKARKLIPSASHEFLLVPLIETPLSDPEIPSSWNVHKPVAQPQVANLTDAQVVILSSLIANGCVEGLLPVPEPGEFIQWGPHIQQLLPS